MAQEKNINDLINDANIKSIGEASEESPYRDIIKELDEKQAKAAAGEGAREEKNMEELSGSKMTDARADKEEEESGDLLGEGQRKKEEKMRAEEEPVIPKNQLAMLRGKKEQPSKAKAPAKGIGELLQKKGEGAESKEADMLSKYGVGRKDVAEAKKEGGTEGMRAGGKMSQKGKHRQRAKGAEHAQKKEQKVPRKQTIVKKVAKEAGKGVLTKVLENMVAVNYPSMLVMKVAKKFWGRGKKLL